MTVEPLVLWQLYQSVTEPFSQPDEKSRCTGPFKNRVLDDEIAVLQGVREGVRAEGTRVKDELRMDSCRTANSSSILDDFEDLNMRPSE
jgi:hypothetical protein